MRATDGTCVMRSGSVPRSATKVVAAPVPKMTGTGAEQNPLVCADCGKPAKSKAGLAAHRRSHSSATPQALP